MPDLMTLDEAMQILTIIYEDTSGPYLHNERTAMRLGKEAMLRIYRQRRNEIPINQPPLPRERMI